MEDYTLEIRAGEGGDDSKLFVKDLMQAYIKMLDSKGWKRKNLVEVSGYSAIEIEAPETFQQEAGGHRIQRIPPTERNGRVHTSTVTVAVLSKDKSEFILSEKDLRLEWFSGTGAGGQHRNKHQNSCRLIHIPTGFVSTSQTRTRENSYKTALDDLTKKLKEQHRSNISNSISETRLQQVGSGMRADKIRTYRFQDDLVKDHNSGKSSKVSKIMNGNFDLLWS